MRTIALEAAERASEAVERTPDVITTFPGGVASSGSKAGSSYDFLIAATYAEFCPTLREELGERSRVPEGVHSIMEIIMNGRDLEALQAATRNAILAAAPTERTGPHQCRQLRRTTRQDLCPPSRSHRLSRGELGEE